MPQGSVISTIGTLISTLGIFYHYFTNDTQLYNAIKSKRNGDLAALSTCADAVIGWAGTSRSTSWMQPKLRCWLSVHANILFQTGPIWWYGGFQIQYTFRQETVITTSDARHSTTTSHVSTRRATTTWAPYAISVRWSPKMPQTPSRLHSSGPDNAIFLWNHSVQSEPTIQYIQKFLARIIC